MTSASRRFAVLGILVILAPAAHAGGPLIRMVASISYVDGNGKGVVSLTVFEDGSLGGDSVPAGKICRPVLGADVGVIQRLVRSKQFRDSLLAAQRRLHERPQDEILRDTVTVNVGDRIGIAGASKLPGPLRDLVREFNRLYIQGCGASAPQIPIPAARESRQ
jgi:hypothetical protein